MVRTLDFVFQLQKNETKRAEIYRLMNSEKDEEKDIQGWHLLFDQKRKWVVVTNNGTDDYLECKFVPAEISYESLIHIMDPSKFDEDIDFEMRYLE